MQVGEIRPATVDDFKQLLEIVFGNEDWECKPNKGNVKIWTKSIASSPVKMIKLACDFDDLEALTLYDVLHDPKFRSVWDESMIEGLDIYKIDEFNDIGYYSLRCPPPLKNRDFVNQRSWGIFGDDHMIMNHTIDIEEMPVKKDFVRGVSYLTGYVVRKRAEGCSVYYITQNDPGGQVPKWILNRVSSVIAPKVLEKIYKAALTYNDWKSSHEPHWRPWRGIGQDSKPLWPRLSTCKSSNSTPSFEVHSKAPIESNGAPPKQNGNHVNVGEPLPQKANYGGSLDSLAPVRADTLAAPHVDSPRQDTASPDPEIIGNVFNLPVTSRGVESRETGSSSELLTSRPPLVRHESITIRMEEEIASSPGGRNKSSENRRSLLHHTPSFDQPIQNNEVLKSRPPRMQHSGSFETPTQPISNTINHRSANHIPNQAPELADQQYGMQNSNYAVNTQYTHAGYAQGQSQHDQMQQSKMQQSKMQQYKMHQPQIRQPQLQQPQMQHIQMQQPQMQPSQMEQSQMLPSQMQQGQYHKFQQQNAVPQSLTNSFQDSNSLNNNYPNNYNTPNANNHHHVNISNSRKSSSALENPILSGTGQLNVDHLSSGYSVTMSNYQAAVDALCQLGSEQDNRATNPSTYLPSSLPPTSLQTPPPHVTSSHMTSSYVPSSRQGARGMNTADSFDGSQISDLCHSLSQLTKGTGSSSNARRAMTPTSSITSPAGGFASISVSAHPIDPDCCTRVSRHVLGTYGGRGASPVSSSVGRYTPTSALRNNKHRQQVDPIPEKAEYRVKKKKHREPEGLESSTLKFLSGMKKDKTQPKRKKKSNKQTGEERQQRGKERDRRRTEST